MPIRTRRWNDPIIKGEGTRILITRFRPRGVRKEREGWDEWLKHLGPSEELHAAAYGKGQEPISFDEYRERYLQEMTAQGPRIHQLAERVRAGESISLLCSSACPDPERCHRTLLKELIEAELPAELHSPAEARPGPAAVPKAFSKLKDWLE